MKKNVVAIVEDDFIIQLFIANILRKMNVSLMGEYDSGESILTALNNEKPDLILMDVGLSGKLDGIETAKLINDEYDIPIVFLSGNSDMGTYNRAKALNPLGFIKKPIDEYSFSQYMTKIMQELSY